MRCSTYRRAVGQTLSELHCPCLIALAGLPASGKTTLSRSLAVEIGAVHLRIDTIETAMLAALDLPCDLRDAGYRVAYALACDHLRLGQSVIADCMNAIDVTRRAWQSVAAETGAAYLGIEILCSDPEEHRRRAETRNADLPGQNLPDWMAIQTRQYESWQSADIRIDTAGASIRDSVAALAGKVRAALANR